jgi:hypothetical protein
MILCKRKPAFQNELITAKLITLLILATAARKGCTMKAKIVVATVSGKAYYLLVNELKRRNTPFLSLTLDEPIPLDVKVVITTKDERARIKHENVIEYEAERDPAEFVDEAIRVVKGKRTYDDLVVGIDPGQNFGVAVIGDGNIIETMECNSADSTVNSVRDALNRIPANHVIIRIGDGAPGFADELLHALEATVPKDVAIESVKEEGTSRLYGEDSHRRGKRDISSAIRIGQRQGKAIPRRRSNA